MTEKQKDELYTERSYLVNDLHQHSKELSTHAILMLANRVKEIDTQLQKYEMEELKPLAMLDDRHTYTCNTLTDPDNHHSQCRRLAHCRISYENMPNCFYVECELHAVKRIRMMKAKGIDVARMEYLDNGKM